MFFRLPPHRLRVFYHQGECLLVHLRPGTPEAEGEEVLAEVVARLSAVTQGAETQVRKERTDGKEHMPRNRS